MFVVTSPLVINVSTRGLLAVETLHAIVQWLANLNTKRNMTSMFVNKKHRYYSPSIIFVLVFLGFQNSLTSRVSLCLHHFFKKILFSDHELFFVIMHLIIPRLNRKKNGIVLC